MHQKTFDRLSVAAGSLSRRASILGGAGAALAVAAAPPASAGKAGKKAKKKCRKQIGQCEPVVAAFCAQAPFAECAEAMLLCCASFKGCHAGAAYDCMLDVLLNPPPPL